MATPATSLPTVTGNPAVDSLIRNGLTAASASLSAVILTWLNAHGFNDPNLNLMLSGIIFAVLVALAGLAWGYLKGTELDSLIEAKQTEGVNAGMQLAASGQMLTMETPLGVAPIPATTASAKAIIQNFGKQG